MTFENDANKPSCSRISRYVAVAIINNLRPLGGGRLNNNFNVCKTLLEYLGPTGAYSSKVSNSSTTTPRNQKQKKRIALDYQVSYLHDKLDLCASSKIFFNC
jgi:hypothetical protein